MVFTSFSLAFQFSSFQSAAGTKYRMSAFGKVEHDTFNSFIPFSIRLVDMGSVPFLLGSRPQKRPMSLREFSSVLSDSESIRNTIFFPRLVQAMPLYIDMKMILPLNCSGSPFDLVIIFWILSRIHNIVNPGNFVHSNSTGSPVDPIRTTRFQKPFNLAFPCLDWFVTAASQNTALSQKRRVFGSCKLNSSVS